MGMYETYGDIGSSAYKRWEAEYKKIEKEIKFGNAVETTAFDRLKKELSNDIDRFLSERQNKRKFAWTSTLLAPVILGVGSLIVTTLNINGILVLLPFVGFVFPVYGFSSLKAYKQALVAAVDFDNEYFDGEVLYKRKNGIPI